MGKIVKFRKNRLSGTGSLIKKTGKYQKTKDWVGRVLGLILWRIGIPGFVRPVAFYDEVEGHSFNITTTGYYTKISINGRDYFFSRLTGKFDGTGKGFDHNRKKNLRVMKIENIK